MFTSFTNFDIPPTFKTIEDTTKKKKKKKGELWTVFF
jgi:hypothetical protein